jgi:hypothetical protein
MQKQAWKLVCILLLFLVSQGCAKLAFRFAPSLIPNLTQAVFEECDADLAKLAIPADLKLMEGLLKSDPGNKQLLTALSMGFTGYAMLFLEETDPERASQFYLRAKSYGLQAIGPKASAFQRSGLKMKSLRDQLDAIGEEHLEALFWTTTSWNGWINLNLDKPTALAQLDIAGACLERILEMKPTYFYGTAFMLMGTLLAARPRMLGGDEKKAHSYFEKAMNVTKGKFFLVHYHYAKHYAVRVQDKKLFLRLIEHVSAAPSDDLKEICLINAVMKAKIKRLREKVDELFI